MVRPAGYIACYEDVALPHQNLAPDHCFVEGEDLRRFLEQ